MARKLKLVFSIILLLIAIVSIAFAQTVAPVKVVAARVDAISKVIGAHGIIQPYPKDDVKISAVSPMRIETILVKPGDPIKKDQLVIKLQRDQSIDMAVEKTRIAMAQAKLNWQRAQKLFENGVIAKVKLEQAQTAYNLAKADYEIQQRSMEYAINNSEIRSPIRGLVSSVNGVVGQIADPSQVLVRIVNVQNIIANIGIEVEDIGKIKVGQYAEITIPNLPDGRIFKGQVIKQNKEIDPSTQLINIWIELDNRNGLLQPGMFCVAHVFVNTVANALVVPKSAVLQDEKGAYLFIIEGNKAHQVYIETGIVTGKKAQIIKGIQKGQPVVYLGNYELEDGMQVNIQE